MSRRFRSRGVVEDIGSIFAVLVLVETMVTTAPRFGDETLGIR